MPASSYSEKKIEGWNFFLFIPADPIGPNKDIGAWSIPKGEFADNEDPFTAALREFNEETGNTIDCNELIELSPVKLKGGKMVYAWAVRGNIDAGSVKSNTFEIEWPPRSGKKQSFPEIDKGTWFPAEEAKEKINKTQASLIDELLNHIARRS